MAPDPYKYFRVEAQELLEQLGQGALDIAKGKLADGGVAALLRHAHTLKGAARVVKQIEIADQAHAIEDALAPYRAPGSAVPEQLAPVLFDRLDAAARLLSALSPSLEERGPSDGHKRDPGAAISGPDSVDAAATLRAELGDVDEVIQGLTESLVQLETLHHELGRVERNRQLCQLLGRQIAAARRGDPAQLSAALDRAERIMQDLNTGLGDLDRGAGQQLERLRRELGETHSNAERLRLIPAQSIFQRLERAAHDAARELGKHVRFEASGGDVRLDGHVLGLVEQALMHVVRNAIAHGLEPEAERRRAGKPPQGNITLEVRRATTAVTFSCRDDGGGLDFEAVQRALGVGRAVPEAELLQRLLQGGVSTAKRLTEVAGRGVGLDVVRSAAERLGGSVRIHTERGRGLQVEIEVPVSVAAFTALLAECGPRIVSLPLASALKSARFARHEITRTPEGQGVPHEHGMIPFAPLERLLGGDEPDPRDYWTAVIIKSGSAQAALGVDRLLGTRVVVQRPLPKAGRISDVVAGASLDALGNPEIVLDPAALIRAVHRAYRPVAPVEVARAPILIVDDSLTTRMLEQSILESAGYDVELATSGEEGLAKARDRAYSLFLVDVEMPGIDGFTFVDRARRDPELMRVPAVLVSSRSAPEDLARGKAAGARGYIVKDRFDQRELLGLIRELTGT